MVASAKQRRYRKISTGKKIPESSSRLPLPSSPLQKRPPPSTIIIIESAWKSGMSIFGNKRNNKKSTSQNHDSDRSDINGATTGPLQFQSPPGIDCHHKDKATINGEVIGPAELIEEGPEEEECPDNSITIPSSDAKSLPSSDTHGQEGPPRDDPTDTAMIPANEIRDPRTNAPPRTSDNNCHVEGTMMVAEPTAMMDYEGEAKHDAEQEQEPSPRRGVLPPPPVVVRFKDESLLCEINVFETHLPPVFCVLLRRDMYDDDEGDEYQNLIASYHREEEGEEEEDGDGNGVLLMCDNDEEKLQEEVTTTTVAKFGGEDVKLKIIAFNMSLLVLLVLLLMNDVMGFRFSVDGTRSG